MYKRIINNMHFLSDMLLLTFALFGEADLRYKTMYFHLFVYMEDGILRVQLNTSQNTSQIYKITQFNWHHGALQLLSKSRNR